MDLVAYACFLTNTMLYRSASLGPLLRTRLISGTMRVVAVKDYIGSTSSFYRVEDGIVLKSLCPAIAERDAYKVTVERKILERLGQHPRIIKYVVSAYVQPTIF
jgi:hypothetical protein